MHIKKSFIDLSNPSVLASFGGSEAWELVEFPPEHVILKEGEESSDFYYVLSGELEVYKSVEDGTSQEVAKTLVLANLEAGDVFGEGALLSDLNRGASVKVKMACKLYKLPQKNFEALVLTDPHAAVGIVLGLCKILNGRFMDANETLAQLRAECASHLGVERQPLQNGQGE
jgi:CRP-like cAMP-binding protein